MNNPFVSVIIPAYNAESDILKCVESVIRQTYQNFEIIIIDDGSEDRTIEVLRNIKNQNKTKQITILQQPNSGPSRARNYGICIAKGAYIAFLDSDDEWYPHKLESIINCFERNKHLSIIGSYYSIGIVSSFREHIGVVKTISLSELLIKNSLITSATVCKSSVIKQFRFNEEQKYSEDYRLWLEMCSRGYQCGLLQQCLVKMCDKPIYGSRGLGSKLLLMEKGELDNYRYLFKNHKISITQYLFASVVSLSKFVKRQFVTLFANINIHQR